ncbi:MAG: alpha/beta fold hydrolase [Bacteroidetes bacterium]|nr:MAG: alpha/beta fold hydrolase [Bacteroidota bacterium]
MRTKITILLLFMVIFGECLQSQNLSRKPWLGAQVQPINEENYQKLGLEKPTGILVLQVVGGTSQKLNLQPNDVILAINDNPITEIQTLMQILSKFVEGEKADFLIVRAGKQQHIKGLFVGRPLENDANADVIYDWADYKTGKLRVIINKPKKEGKLPAVLFIPGYTCTSIDGLSENHPYGRVVRAFSEAGYVVLRIEKSGLGDSQNTPPCEDCTLKDEIESFEKGLQKLQSLPYVDTDNIFIFGHSMGGVVAPAVSAKNNVRGVMVYGTTAKSWYEYQLELNRLQGFLAQPDPMEYEAYCRIQAEIAYQYFIERKELAKIAEDPTKDSLLRTTWEYDGKGRIYSRNAEFWRQIQDLPLLDNWKNTKAKVLVMYGEADFQAFSKADHEQIVYTVNYFKPNNAALKVFPETDHYFAKSGTMKNAFDMFNQRKILELFNLFNPDITKTIVEWANSTKK